MAGAIPDSLGQLGGLQTMDLSGNQLSGECGFASGTWTRSNKELGSVTGKAVRGAGAHLGLI